MADYPDVLKEFDFWSAKHDDAVVAHAELLEEIAMTEDRLNYLKHQAEATGEVVDGTTKALNALWKNKIVRESMVGPPNPEVFDV